MPEQITVTMPLELAEALVDAAACLWTAAEGDIVSLTLTYMTEGRPASESNDTYKREIADRAQEACDMLRPEIDAAYKRDPWMQLFIHRLKMMRKYGLFKS